jgi:hypothetical protein
VCEVATRDDATRTREGRAPPRARAPAMQRATRRRRRGCRGHRRALGVLRTRCRYDTQRVCLCVNEEAMVRGRSIASYKA